MTIYKMLDCSTGHLKQATCEAGGAETLPVVTYDFEYGFFCHVPSPEDLADAGRDLPDDLNEVLIYARSIGCDWIKFDRDGDMIEGLPLYEW